VAERVKQQRQLEKQELNDEALPLKSDRCRTGS
jgi:hypothetical protein